jgi:hypothetical protein
MGVPLRTPPALMLNPAGRVPPLTVKTYGAIPPAAERLWEYPEPTVAAAKETGDNVITGQTLRL